MSPTILTLNILLLFNINIIQMSKDYVENLITVMTKKDTKSKEAMNILVF
jgi:hypothetical protein